MVRCELSFFFANAPPFVRHPSLGRAPKTAVDVYFFSVASYGRPSVRTRPDFPPRRFRSVFGRARAPVSTARSQLAGRRETVERRAPSVVPRCEKTALTTIIGRKHANRRANEKPLSRLPSVGVIAEYVCVCECVRACVCQ